MSSDVVDKTRDGLRRYLSEVWGTPVEITDLAVASAGARRRNVLFTAVRAGEAVGLVATIMPTAGMQLMSMDVEAANLRLAEKAGVPVAHVHEVCLDDSYVGGPFFLTTRIDGETLPRQVLRLVDATPGLGPLLARQLGEAFARLHAVDIAEASPELRRPAEGLSGVEAALAGVEESLDNLLQPSPAFELAYGWLSENRPPPTKLAVIHSDCRNGNIIVGPDGLRAILDWEGCHIGDPMEDVAWPCQRMWRFRNDHLEVGGFATRDELRAGYEAAGGHWDEGSFHWWKVLATLRWGLGLAGQARQHLDGTYRSIVMAASGRRVAELEYDTLMLLRGALG